MNSDHICNIVNAAMASSGAGTGPFDQFLNWLSPDRDEAVKEYEKIRKYITRYFIRKGCPGVDVDEEVGKTLDRVLQLEDRWSKYSMPLAFCLGVARFIWLEYIKRPKPFSIDDPDFVLPPPLPPDPAPDPQRGHCLRKCLSELPEEKRALFIKYHQGRGREKIENRKRLAAEHGGRNNLRLKICRTGAELRSCIQACMQSKPN